MYPTAKTTMMRISCDLDGCWCRRTLFTVAGFRGRVSTKCFTCHTFHDFTFGGGEPATHEVRCDGSFKGHDLGGWCSMLIARISPDSAGSFGYRCPRCKAEKTIRIQAPMLVST